MYLSIYQPINNIRIQQGKRIFIIFFLNLFIYWWFWDFYAFGEKYIKNGIYKNIKYIYKIVLCTLQLKVKFDISCIHLY